jgi:ribosome maturation factor RimP
VTDVTTIEQVAASVAAAHDLTLYDVERRGGVVVVLLDRPGGIDIDTIATASRDLSRRLEADELLPASVTLEVSSPGLERRLRTEAHFAGAVGRRVTLRRTDQPETDGDSRLVGTLTAAGDGTVEVTDDAGVVHELPFDSVERARTVFEWGGSPPPKSRNPRRTARTNSEARP